jgi:hypothetical protein
LINLLQSKKMAAQGPPFHNSKQARTYGLFGLLLPLAAAMPPPMASKARMTTIVFVP